MKLISSVQSCFGLSSNDIPQLFALNLNNYLISKIKNAAGIIQVNNFDSIILADFSGVWTLDYIDCCDLDDNQVDAFIESLNNTSEQMEGAQIEVHLDYVKFTAIPKFLDGDARVSTKKIPLESLNGDHGFLNLIESGIF